jgi:hypothetical protein
MRNLFSILIASAFLAGCSDESMDRSDVPLSGAAASAKLYRSLPPSAHDLYFLFFAGGLQDLESYTRMDVNPTELGASVEFLIAENNATLSRTSTYPKAPLPSAMLHYPRKEFLPMTWWNPASVSVGYFRGENEAYSLQIVVDEVHSRIYVYQND